MTDAVPASERRANSDNWKQPLPGRLVERVVAVRPELCDHRVAEDPDPHEECQADVGHIGPDTKTE